MATYERVTKEFEAKGAKIQSFGRSGRSFEIRISKDEKAVWVGYRKFDDEEVFTIEKEGRHDQYYRAGNVDEAIRIVTDLL